mmetsp:Transcript_100116/g.298805  ORF Transcript_100116/g.298805 Transcript_100116/m.298805 type:complete len:590 (-) Transcript_100116:94-1863(-)
MPPRPASPLRRTDAQGTGGGALRVLQYQPPGLRGPAAGAQLLQRPRQGLQLLRRGVLARLGELPRRQLDEPRVREGEGGGRPRGLHHQRQDQLLAALHDRVAEELHHRGLVDVEPGVGLEGADERADQRRLLLQPQGLRVVLELAGGQRGRPRPGQHSGGQGLRDGVEELQVHHLEAAVGPGRHEELVGGVGRKVLGHVLRRVVEEDAVADVDLGEGEEERGHSPGIESARVRTDVVAGLLEERRVGPPLLGEGADHEAQGVQAVVLDAPWHVLRKVVVHHGVRQLQPGVRVQQERHRLGLQLAAPAEGLVAQELQEEAITDAEPRIGVRHQRQGFPWELRDLPADLRGEDREEAFVRHPKAREAVCHHREVPGLQRLHHLHDALLQHRQEEVVPKVQPRVRVHELSQLRRREVVELPADLARKEVEDQLVLHVQPREGGQEVRDVPRLELPEDCRRRFRQPRHHVAIAEAQPREGEEQRGHVRGLHGRRYDHGTRGHGPPKADARPLLASCAQRHPRQCEGAQPRDWVGAHRHAIQQGQTWPCPPHFRRTAPLLLRLRCQNSGGGGGRLLAAAPTCAQALVTERRHCR